MCKWKNGAGLGRDESGAIMVMGVVMAVFLVAILYYTIGIGEALHHRQRMQDAADAAAFSAAVVHARGMNIIALVNMIMAALLAILVAIKMVETVLIAAIALLALMSFFTGGAAAAAIPELEAARRSMHQLYRQMRPPVYSQLQALNSVARAVRVTVPVAAEGRVLDTVVGHYNPPAHIGVVIPSRWTLPVQNDRFDVLCDKAADNVGGVVEWSVEQVLPGILGDHVGDLIGSATADLGRSLSRWFCGDGEIDLPEPTARYTKTYPILPSRDACSRYARHAGNERRYEAEEHQRLCQMAEEDEEASAPDDSGDCQHLNDPDRQDDCAPYWQRVRLARQQCHPRTEPDMDAFRWQERTIRVYYENAISGWQLHREVVSARVRGGREPPCDENEWQTGFVDSADPSLSIPVCREASECPEPAEPVPDENGHTTEPPIGQIFESCEYREVAQIIGCERQVEETFAPDVGPEDRISGRDRAGGPETRSPQKIEDEVELGGDDFQMRAIVFGRLGSGLSRRAEAAIGLATWPRRTTGGRPRTGISAGRDGAGFYETARNLGRLSVAQAEYYYGEDHDRSEWLWHMAWQARLRRLRLPRSSMEQACRNGQQRRGNGQQRRGNGQQRRGDGQQRRNNGQQRRGNGQQRRDDARQGGGGVNCEQIANDLQLLDGLVVH